MPTIILEGPDSSGKTTLAQALVGYMGPDLCQVVKSPSGRTTEWDASWNYWNAQYIERSYVSGLIYILDRTPEISELVYGPIVRGFTRLHNPLESLQRLKHPDTLTIMTSTDKPYLGGHTDAQGNPIYEHSEKITASYNMINLLMKYDGYQMGWWDYGESEIRYIVNRIISIFNPTGLTVVRHQDQYYIDKGKEILDANGS